MASLTPRIDSIDKNFLLNGGMEYFQVSTDAAVAASYDYTGPDMFELEQTGSWASPNAERSTTKVGTKSRRSLLFTGTAGLATDEFHAKTKIESIFAYELANSNFSLGFNLKSDNFTQVRIVVSYANTEDVFSAVTQIAETTVTFDADTSIQEIKFEDIATNTLVANGLQVEFEFKGGSAAAANLHIGEFRLNKGKTVNEFTPFGADFVEDLKYCRRYFEKSYDLDTTPSTITTVGSFTTDMTSGGDQEALYFNSRKRTTPTMVLYNPNTGATGTWYDGSNRAVAPLAGHTSPDMFGVAITGVSALTIRGHWTADARL